MEEKEVSKEINRWKGFVLGAVGGIAGVTAMEFYWKAVISINGSDPRQQTQGQGQGQSQGESAQGAQGGQAKKEPGPLDDISLLGKQHEEGESSTGAMGRIAYRLFTGKEPRSKETRLTLSYIAHWVFSMTVAGLYGALRGPVKIPDIGGGLALG